MPIAGQPFYKEITCEKSGLALPLSRAVLLIGSFIHSLWPHSSSPTLAVLNQAIAGCIKCPRLIDHCRSRRTYETPGMARVGLLG